MENRILFYSCCNVLSDTPRCPVCCSKQGQEPQPEDICFLTEQDKIWSGMLEDVLLQNDIPVITKSNIGAGVAIKAGSMFERFRFYVPYSHMTQAKDIVDALFAEIPDDETETESDPHI